MDTFFAEVDENFKSFFEALPKTVSDAVTALESKENDFRDSYRRLVSMQGWRTLTQTIVDNKEVLDFFLEAQNDALSSHMLARQGAWRSSLMCLRSLIENILFFIYYKDHLVEYQLWSDGRHKMAFSELHSYLEGHPRFKGLPKDLSGLDPLKQEYSTLSRAVHGSSKSFRMTKTGKIEGLNKPEAIELSQWLTREKKVLEILNSILLVVFSEQLQGAAHRDLRKAVAFSLKSEKLSEFKCLLGVTLRKPEVTD